MAAPENHWKLGLFVVAGLALILATLVLLATRSMQEVGIYVSYFDESVQGLEVGSPIKFRGVTIGTVGKIMVAPDHRHVEIESELEVKQLTRLGLNVAKESALQGAPLKLEQTIDLRLQLASAGLTGVKFLQLDFFDVKAYPPPILPFPVPSNYIPTAPSMLKNIEDSINSMANRLPEITDQAASILGDINVIVHGMREQHLPERIDATLGKLDSLVAAAHQKLKQLDSEGLSRNATQALAGVTTAVGRLDGIFTRIDLDDGLLTSVKRASDAIGDIMRDADGLGGQFVETLKSLKAAALSIRMFSEALEQDPDMLLKGRSPERKP
jgi:phospholipid/cholesterol/gamma-HCH transport system substrate-binding protein